MQVFPSFASPSIFISHNHHSDIKKMKAEAEAPEAGETSSRHAISALEMNRGISILDLILRIIAVVGTFGSAIAMGTTNETISIFPQFSQVTAEYDDLPTFTYVFLSSLLLGSVSCLCMKKKLT